jgi:hypothetical protein
MPPSDDDSCRNVASDQRAIGWRGGRAGGRARHYGVGQTWRLLGLHGLHQQFEGDGLGWASANPAAADHAGCWEGSAQRLV